MKPGFAKLGLEMIQFVVESVSLPEELQKVMDQRIGDEHGRGHRTADAV